MKTSPHWQGSSSRRKGWRLRLRVAADRCLACSHPHLNLRETEGVGDSCSCMEGSSCCIPNCSASSSGTCRGSGGGRRRQLNQALSSCCRRAGIHLRSLPPIPIHGCRRLPSPRCHSCFSCRQPTSTVNLCLGGSESAVSGPGAMRSGSSWTLKESVTSSVFDWRQGLGCRLG